MVQILLTLVYVTKFGATLALLLSAIIGIDITFFHTTLAQTNTSDVISSSNLSTALEELQSPSFTLITVNTEQIQELRSTVNQTNQAIENGNMTEALIRLST